VGRVGVTGRYAAWGLVGVGLALVVTSLMVLFGVLFGAVFALVTGLFLSGAVLAVVGFVMDVDKRVRG
jgi:ABC-type phosphate/phosphonate transport system permease subunit